MLLVVGERQVRGTVERTYALSTADAQIIRRDLANMTPDDHRRAFMAFLAGLLADMDQYIEPATSISNWTAPVTAPSGCG